MALSSVLAKRQQRLMASIIENPVTEEKLAPVGLMCLIAAVMYAVYKVAYGRTKEIVGITDLI